MYFLSPIHNDAVILTATGWRSSNAGATMRTAATGSRRPRIYKLQTIKILKFLIEISTNSKLGVHCYRKYPFSFAHRNPPKVTYHYVYFRNDSITIRQSQERTVAPRTHPIPPGGSPLKDDRIYSGFYSTSHAKVAGL